ncbi:putative transcriptional regulatory protein [Neofusicoccum parvum]|uniref:Transcriptional regulatory protein n=1 Tax=Neofusicoccum parvum TaxID=310453 RepID=A0ACB5S5B2_9PEZI|nr:putative transcriptional regulatory protein [Neofusicoccum parvum]
MPTPAHALSCVTCRQRKIRCDKVHPCSACRRSGVECVFPAQRAQRRKQGRRNEELLRRLDHLEGLVDRLGGEVAVAAHAATGEPLAQPEDAPSDDFMAGVLLPHVLQPRVDQGTPREDGTYPVMKEDGGRYLGEDFWTSLSTEVEGLRELLNEPESDDEPDTGHTSVSSAPTHVPYEKRLMNSLFVFSGDIEATDLRWLHPPGPHIDALSDVYWDRVDIIFKILHRPTFEPLLKTAAQDAASIPKGAGYEALMFAMYFAAAFSLYLLCLRCHNKTRSVWTLIGLAVRIAQDLNLHRDGAVTGFSPYDTEMRRRLWWQIAVLDIRACEDRGSFPLIDHSLCSTKMPLNINDDDISPDMRTAPPERVGCSDVSFSRLCQEASLVAPRFFSPVPASVDDDQKREHWQTKIQQEVDRFKERLHNKFIIHCSPSVPIQYVILQVVHIITSEFWLLVHYPIQTRRYAFKSKATKQEILDVAITHLRIDMELEIHPVSAKYKWYYDTYVQWHPLAVALAELCVQTRGPLVDRAWKVVDAVYERARSRVTDVSLWRPVKKLHQKALKARAQALRAPATADSMSSSHAPSESPDASTTTMEASPPPLAPLLPLDNLDRFLAGHSQAQTASPFQQHHHQHPSPSSTNLATFPPVLHPSSLPPSSSQQHQPSTAAGHPQMDLLSAAEHMSNMNLDAYGDPVNWHDWNDFVQSTWVADDPSAPQQKTNTPEWLLDMGMGGAAAGTGSGAGAGSGAEQGGSGGGGGFR